MDASGAVEEDITPYKATVGLYKELNKPNKDVSIDQVRYWIEHGARLRGYACRQGIPLLYAIEQHIDLPIIRLLAEHTGNILNYKCYIINSLFNSIDSDDERYDKNDNVFDKYYVEVQSAYNILLCKYYAAHGTCDYNNYIYDHMYKHGYISQKDLQFKEKNPTQPHIDAEWLNKIRAICEIIGLDYESLCDGKPEFAPNLRDYRNTVNMMKRNYYDRDYIFYESDTDDESYSQWSSSDESAHAGPDEWDLPDHSPFYLAKQ